MKLTAVVLCSLVFASSAFARNDVQSQRREARRSYVRSEGLSIGNPKLMQTGSFNKLGIRDERIKTAGFDFDKHEGKFVKKLVVVAKSPNGEGDIQALMNNSTTLVTSLGEEKVTLSNELTILEFNINALFDGTRFNLRSLQLLTNGRVFIDSVGVVSQRSTDCRKGLYRDGDEFLSYSQPYRFDLKCPLGGDKHEMRRDVSNNQCFLGTEINLGVIDSEVLSRGGSCKQDRVEPNGVLDSYDNNSGFGQGWAFDKDDQTKPVEIHFYAARGPLHNPTERVGLQATSFSRKRRHDVEQAHNVRGAEYGYEFNLNQQSRQQLSKNGWFLEVWALDVNQSGRNKRIYPKR